MISDQDIKPEELLLIKLCRLEFDHKLKDEAESICRIITEWEFFARAVNLHGISALVHNNMEKLGLLKYVPRKIAEFLSQASYLSIVRNTAIMQNMTEALAFMGKEKFKTVLLKGMALELMVYGNRGLRQMTDADVLLQADEGMKAFRMLRKKGFTPLPVKSVLHKLIIRYIGKHFPSLIKNGFSLEIHHELFGRTGKHLTSKLLETSTKTTLNDHEAWLPDPMMLFIYLIHHLYKHETNNDSQLRLYTDLVVMIEQYKDKIINPLLLKLSAEAGFNRILADRLLPLIEYWKMEFPGWLNEFISDNKGEDSLSRFVFFLKSPKSNPAPERSHSYRPLLREIPGFHRKVIYVAGDIFPTIGFMKKRYRCNSVWKALAYYPHRLGKLVWLLKK